MGGTKKGRNEDKIWLHMHYIKDGTEVNHQTDISPKEIRIKCSGGICELNIGDYITFTGPAQIAKILLTQLSNQIPSGTS